MTHRQLELQANEIREDIIKMLVEAGSGHSAGPLGLADIFTALYFEVMDHRPKQPDWPGRDRLILSNGHTVPVRYATMARAGYFPVKELATLRKLGSRLQGHPERVRLPGMETTSGPLGSGLSQAAGMALALRMDGGTQHVYCVTGDGELNEGNIWEGIMFAAKNKLNNLTVIVDRNNIQIDGPTEQVMPLDDLAAKWAAFNWHVIEIDGNNIDAIIASLKLAKAIVERPTVIIAHTVAGKGVDFMEYDYHWHGYFIDEPGAPPKKDQARIALHELRTLGGQIRFGARIMIDPAQHLNPDLLSLEVKQEAIRMGFGRGLVAAGKADKNVVALCADLTESTRIIEFAEAFPDRYVEIGIGEQNLVTVAAGMALAGKVPFTASYAAFSPGRNWEQIRTTICLNQTNVKIVGAHAGVSVGPDGATHQMLEDIALMRVLPNMTVVAPCDSVEAEKATRALAGMVGPAYIRLAREKSPVVTTDKSPFSLSKAQVLRRGKDLTIVACGMMVYQALMAAETLAKHGLEAEVINAAVIKPLDVITIVASAKKTGAVLTVEEAQAAAGLGGAVAEALADHHPVPLKRVGLLDRFGESGAPDQLLEYFGLTAPHLVKHARELVKRKL